MVDVKTGESTSCFALKHFKVTSNRLEDSSFAIGATVEAPIGRMEDRLDLGCPRTSFKNPFFRIVFRQTKIAIDTYLQWWACQVDGRHPAVTTVHLTCGHQYPHRAQTCQPRMETHLALLIMGKMMRCGLVAFRTPRRRAAVRTRTLPSEHRALSTTQIALPQRQAAVAAESSKTTLKPTVRQGCRKRIKKSAL